MSTHFPSGIFVRGKMGRKGERKEGRQKEGKGKMSVTCVILHLPEVEVRVGAQNKLSQKN